MPKQLTRGDALTRGQLARRWGVCLGRVRQLIEAGLLPGVFEIPPAGKFGKVVKVPMNSILAAEKKWKITPVGDGTHADGSRADPQVVGGQADPHVGAGAAPVR